MCLISWNPVQNLLLKIISFSLPKPTKLLCNDWNVIYLSSEWLTDTVSSLWWLAIRIVKSDSPLFLVCRLIVRCTVFFFSFRCFLASICLGDQKLTVVRLDFPFSFFPMHRWLQIPTGKPASALLSIFLLVVVCVLCFFGCQRNKEHKHQQATSNNHNNNNGERSRRTKWWQQRRQQ